MSEELNIQIDGKSIRVKPGTTVLEAATELGIEIPTMCHVPGLEHHTSCMMCMVRDRSRGSLFASCSMPVADGMDIISQDEEVIQARKMALELLLSEHIGDCQAPCQLACPAHMDIPLMNRLLKEGRFEEAYEVVMQDIPLPGVLGRICPAPCEKACKRKDIDEALNICLLKRFAGDEHPGSKFEVRSSKFEIRQSNFENHALSIGVIGSGPAGLTAAYYARLQGYAVTLYEKEAQAGGNLRHPDLAEKLPADVLDREIQTILATGIELKTKHDISAADLEGLLVDHAAIIWATGQDGMVDMPAVIPVKAGSKMAIQAVAKGKEAALKAHQLLQGQEAVGEARRFNSRTGKLTEADYEAYLREATSDPRQEPDKVSDGFTAEQVKTEAARCMHCDCRKPHSCKLRDYAEAYGAGQRRFSYGERKAVSKQLQQDLVVYEAGKCIKCGICVRLTRKYKEKFGFTFIGRGFDVEVRVPFDEPLGRGLAETARIVADACPTGAISPIEDRRPKTEDRRPKSNFLNSLTFLLILVFGLWSSVFSQNWPIFRGDPQLLGVSAETFETSPKLLWSMKPGNGIKASPVVSEGIMVVGCDNGLLYALDENGTKRWEYDTGHAIEAPALILDGTVYVGNLYGDLLAIDLQTGELKWKYLTDNQISGSVNYFQSGKKLHLLVGSYDYYLHCVDGQTGDSIWKYETDNFINGAAGIFDGKAIFGGCDGYLHIIDILTGKPVNKIEVATYVASSVAVIDNEAFLGDYDGRFSCVDLTAGKIAWKYEHPDLTLPFIGSPSIKGDLVVIGNRDKNVYCFSKTDGRLMWKTTSGSRVDASPVIVGKHVLIANMRGDLQLMDLKTGKMSWNYETGSGIIGNPAVANGKIWVAAGDGFIYCFGK